MAVSPEQRAMAGQRSPAATFISWLRKIANSLARPLFALLLAIIAGSIIIMITSQGSLGDRFSAVLNAYQSLYLGSFGDPQKLSYTLVKVGPLILTGLSVAIAFRTGLFNIGAAGQLAIGSMAAGIVAFSAPNWPGWLLIPLMIIASALAGAVWGGIVGLLKAWRGAHEVVTTIMLNWIAFYFTDFLIQGPYKSPALPDQTNSLPPQATLPLISNLYNQTLGTFLPQIANPVSYFVDVSFFAALLALVVYWFITRRTAFGYEIRVIGQNPKAAAYAGMPIKRNIILTMAIAGAFAGLAGAFRLMGQSPYQLIANVFSSDPTGFDAIGVALLGRTTSIGILLASLLFGGLRQGSSFMQLNAGVPGDLVLIIQALILFSIASEFLPVIQRSLPNWARLSRRPPLATNVIGQTDVEVSLGENGTSGNGELAQQAPPSPGTASVTPEHTSDRVEED
ncbi:MAG: ABC transporter permease [Ktedonobacteraceae bacterium]|nr:ABC transporter permease [Ktedonobacteraceae bacterium]